MTDFANRLRELRKHRNLRQADLAQAIGVAQTTIANYEKKLRFPDERMLGRFADHFGVSLDYLLGRSDERGGPGGPAITAGSAPGHDQALPEAAARYLGLLRDEGTEAAAEFARDACRTGLGVRGVYLDILEPALKETGRLWEIGRLSVGDEHLITEATRRVMSAVFETATVPEGAPRPRCVVLAVPGEQHTIAPSMVGDLLRLDGWEVRSPGGNLGIRHVIEMLGGNPPDLIALSVTVPANLTAAADLIAAIREKTSLRRLRIAAGGQGFRSDPRLWQDVGADGTAEDAAAAVETCNTLVGRRTAGAAG